VLASDIESAQKLGFTDTRCKLSCHRVDVGMRRVLVASLSALGNLQALLVAVG